MKPKIRKNKIFYICILGTALITLGGIGLNYILSLDDVEEITFEEMLMLEDSMTNKIIDKLPFEIKDDTAYIITDPQFGYEPNTIRDFELIREDPPELLPIEVSDKYDIHTNWVKMYRIVEGWRIIDKEVGPVFMILELKSKRNHRITCRISTDLIKNFYKQHSGYFNQDFRAYCLFMKIPESTFTNEQIDDYFANHHYSILLDMPSGKPYDLFDKSDDNEVLKIMATYYWYSGLLMKKLPVRIKTSFPESFLCWATDNMIHINYVYPKEDVAGTVTLVNNHNEPLDYETFKAFCFTVAQCFEPINPQQ